MPRKLLPTLEELMKDYDKIDLERQNEDTENIELIGDDYSQADRTPRYLREPEPSEILEDKLKKKLEKFKSRKELENFLATIDEDVRESYMEGILKIYDASPDKRF